MQRTSRSLAAGLVAVAVAVTLAAAWVARQPPITARPATVPAGSDEPSVERLRAEVLTVIPHDREAFTQGLVWHDGTLYESTGLYGRSSLREVDRFTGEVRRERRLDPSLFGEGLARVGDRLIQLTWQQGIALVYDLPTFDRVGEHSYTGEGWGLCFDGEQLVMTDGSSDLAFRDPETFAPLGRVAVTLNGRPVERLNELECVGDRVYANIWMTDLIVRIDPRTGRVDAVIDAAGLLAPEERWGTDVLNGIAYDQDNGTFLVTGKLWPKLFEVRFVPVSSERLTARGAPAPHGPRTTVPVVRAETDGGAGAARAGLGRPRQCTHRS